VAALAALCLALHDPVGQHDRVHRVPAMLRELNASLTPWSGYQVYLLTTRADAAGQQAR